MRTDNIDTSFIVEELSRCSFSDWKFILEMDGDRPMLVLEFIAPCSKTGVAKKWRSRKWPLSVHMTRSEIVGTAFKAVMTAIEHEAREEFKYHKRPVFSPHIDVLQLWHGCVHEDVRVDPLARV